MSPDTHTPEWLTEEQIAELEHRIPQSPRPDGLYQYLPALLAMARELLDLKKKEMA